MKISFILLAYKKPEILRPLIETLLKSGSDIYVHYDASSLFSLEDESKQWGLEDYDGNLYHAPRVKVVWGEYSIVQATLNALNLAKKNGYNSDYFMLISGSCMPIKPIWKLEEFLKEDGGDIIEAVDASQERWNTDGIQEERWESYHFFNWRYQEKRFNASLKVQDRLNIKRKLPLAHTPYMGSQWWCLRRSTVDKILSLIAKKPVLKKFYQYTWVPDELFFQTMVGNIIPHDELHNEILTKYQFNSWGIPRVYYDGDLEELLYEKTFFARKISHREKELRKQLSDICLMDKKSYNYLLDDLSSEYAFKHKMNLMLNKELENIKWHSLAVYKENEYDYIKSIPNNITIIISHDEKKKKTLLESFKNLSNHVVYDNLLSSTSVDFGKGIMSVAGYNSKDINIIKNKWYLFLGDIAFKANGKNIVFSMSEDSFKYLNILKWKENLNILLEDQESDVINTIVLDITRERQCNILKINFNLNILQISSKLYENKYANEVSKKISTTNNVKQLIRYPIREVKSFGEQAFVEEVKINRRKIKEASHICVLVCKNELIHLGMILEHHRNIGIEHFIYIDNMSDDDSLHYMEEQNDVSTFVSTQDYKDYRYSVDWLEAIFANFCYGKWVLVVDADELFVYDDFENKPISSLTDYADANGYDSFLAPMVDMYNKDEISKVKLNANKPYEVCNYFDKKQSMSIQNKKYYGSFSNSEVYAGGLRTRIFGKYNTSPTYSYLNQKYCLFKYKPIHKFTEGIHFMGNNSPANVRATLLHFKYHSEFYYNVCEQVISGQHWNDSKEYKRYLRVLEKDKKLSFYDNEISIKYENSSSLIEAGYMDKLK